MTEPVYVAGVGMTSFGVHTDRTVVDLTREAVIQMTANLAAEWGRAGVRVNSVAPGFTRTPLLQSLIDSGERDPSVIEEATALRRLVESDEVAKAVAFLAGPDASAITGATLPIDAGWLVAPTWQAYGGIRREHPAEDDRG